MDQDPKLQSGKNAEAEKPAAAASDLAVDEFFTQLQSDMRRPDLSQEAVAAAFQAIQKLALDSDAEEGAQTAVLKSGGGSAVCDACHSPVRAGSQFCSFCGAHLQRGKDAPPRAAGSSDLAQPAGDHHYHHHYHHHYFPAANGFAQAPAADFRPAASAGSRDPVKARTASGAPSLSRAEAAVRRMTQDWAQACNTKQLDDLVELYANDSLVLRPNLPPIRGTAAIREFFFAALDAGLGDAEFEALRVDLFGDIALEAGRCKTLVPVVVGKRREERGKYLIVFVRQPAGDWKVLVDCWSSDLNLGADPNLKAGVQAVGVSVPRAPRKV